MAYETKFRERVVAFLKEGHTQDETKKIFKVGITTLKRWVKQWKTEGHLERKPPNQSFKKIDPAKLSEFVKNNPDYYLREIGEYFGASAPSVHEALKKLCISLKKRSRDTRSKALKIEQSSKKKS